MSDSDSEPGDDFDEFLAALGGGSKASAADEPKSLLKAPDNDTVDDDDSGKKGRSMVGGPVQYSLFGTGFVPTTKTVQTLPAGAYHIRYSQSVGVYFDTAKIVTDELIEFPDTQSDIVIAEIDKFWTLKEKFNHFKYLHKRGFILWGPQGSGKSSAIAIIMKKMIEKNGLVIVAESPQYLAPALAFLRSVEPDRQVVVIWEDLDSVVRQYGESEVLAILDGESQIDNVCYIATTNFPELLNARITDRPSRFDRIQKIGFPNAESRAIYLRAKTGGIMSPDGVDLVASTDGFSIAHLREVIISVWCLESPTEEVLKRLRKMKTRPSSEGGGEKVGFGG